MQNRKLLDQIKLKKCWIGRDCMGQTDPHHITTVKSGGGDTEDNVIPLCRKHHTEVHARGMGIFMSRYPSFVSWLKIVDRWDVIEKIQSRQ